MKTLTSLFLILLSIPSNGQDTVYISTDRGSYRNVAVIRFVHNIKTNSHLSFRLDENTYILKCKEGGSFDRRPYPRFEFISGMDTMWVEIIFHQSHYKIFIDNMVFRPGYYGLHIDYRARSCVSDGEKKYNINRPLITVKGSEFYNQEKIVMIEEVQWDSKKNEASPEYIFELPNKRSLRTLPITEVKFFYVNLCPQAVLIENGKE